jgi:glycosyltransferase involved in cell wall biosynthesis
VTARAHAPPPAEGAAPEVSVVMPCLNEADTIGTCIEKAQRAMLENGIAGEVIVADNGSTDGSREIAARLGARVVTVEARGYGNALAGGIQAARGKYIIMGDSDDSYDFGELSKFVVKLRQGFDLVQGCRMPSGGGRVMPGAMPVLHHWLGNPLLSLLARRMFWAPVHDVYCGLRGFSRAYYDRLDMRCTGMEYAVEMIVKCGLTGANVAEVPITLYPDGRRAHPPHLRTFQDGWRTLRFLLIYSPRWLFFYPGLALIALGVLGYGLALPGITVRGVRFDAHTLLFASLAVLLGFQAAVFAVFTKVFAIGERLLPEDPRLTRLARVVTLERGLLLGLAGLAGGLALLLAAVIEWRRTDFGDLQYPHTMRLVIPGATLTALGFQTVLSSFFVSILGMRRR